MIASVPASIVQKFRQRNADKTERAVDGFLGTQQNARPARDAGDGRFPARLSYALAATFN
jgi:hypothetical protein